MVHCNLWLFWLKKFPGSHSSFSISAFREPSIIEFIVSAVVIQFCNVEIQKCEQCNECRDRWPLIQSFSQSFRQSVCRSVNQWSVRKRSRSPEAMDAVVTLHRCYNAIHRVTIDLPPVLIFAYRSMSWSNKSIYPYWFNLLFSDRIDYRVARPIACVLADDGLYV